MVARDARGNVVMWLLINSENSHSRFKARGIVQSSNLDDGQFCLHRTAGADGSATNGQKGVSPAALDHRRSEVAGATKLNRIHHPVLA